MNTEPTTEIYDSWEVEVPNLIRNLLLKNKVNVPEDLRVASLGPSAGRKFRMIQQVKKDLGFDLLEPFNYHTWPVEVPGLIHETLKKNGVGVPRDLEHVNIRLAAASKKAIVLNKLRDSLGIFEVSMRIPDQIADMHWDEVPIPVSARSRNVLDEYCLNTIREISQFLASGILACSKSEQSSAKTELANYGLVFQAQLEREIADLCRLGLDTYRNDGLESIHSATDLLDAICKKLSDKEADIFISDKTLQALGDNYGYTRENIRILRNKIHRNLPGKVQLIADELIDRCWSRDGQIAVNLDQAIAAVGAASTHELNLLCQLSSGDYYTDKKKAAFVGLSKDSHDLIYNEVLALLNSNELKPDVSGKFQISSAKGGEKITVSSGGILLLMGSKLLARHIRAQLSRRENGVHISDLHPLGLFSSSQEVVEFLQTELDIPVEITLAGAIRIKGKMNDASDAVVKVLLDARKPLQSAEVNERLGNTWHQARLTNRLSKRLEIVSSERGCYVHISKFGLTIKDVEILCGWAEQAIRNRVDMVSFDELFDIYHGVPDLPKVENPHLLASCAIKHSLVSRSSSSTRVYHVDSYIDANYLVNTDPKIAAEFHPEKNGDIDFSLIRPRSSKVLWWLCPSGHEYQRSVVQRTNPDWRSRCPHCDARWTTTRIREIVKDILPIVEHLDPAERQAIFEHTGLSSATGKNVNFLRSLRSGSLPKEAIDNFIVGNDTGEGLETDQDVGTESFQDGELPSASDLESFDDSHSEIDDVEIVGQGEQSEGQHDLAHDLPEVSTKNALETMDHPIIQSADSETAEFLIEKAKAKIWRHAYRDENQAFAELGKYKTNGMYSERVKAEFQSEYEAARDLVIPPGYSFRVDGEIALPNLMQRHVTAKIKEVRRFGNWSGTGAGKTLSAILATRVTNSKLTVICCPNSVVGDESNGWIGAINEIYPESEVQAKTFAPVWQSESSFKYLILNYERFQQADSESQVKQFVENNDIDFVVIDEIHFAKKRTDSNDKVSLRRKLVEAMIVATGELNPDVCVLGMSATPVINELREGISLIEMITGLEHEDLADRATLMNCNRLHQKMVAHGTRWKPDYKTGLETQYPKVDCSEFIDEILSLGKRASPLDVERILTRARIPEILKHLSRDKPTIIYSFFVTDVVDMLRTAVVNAGYRVGFFTGEHKEGLEDFKNGSVDVLVASASIGTGVDGLQHCCSQLIINSLPWTNAEYEQLIGRIWRQGQKDESVKVIVPVTGATVAGEFWSYCESKLQRIEYKKTIADAVVDGEVPEGSLRSAAQANRDILKWLERLTEGDTRTISRSRIQILLSNDVAEVRRRLASYGDFSQMNGNWNRSKSKTLANRLKDNPEEWCNYHTLYREARQSWSIVPVEEMIRWCLNRPEGASIADFGCGENLLMNGVADKHVVHAFDHISIDPKVTACDMSQVPLEDNVLDVAIFSLSLMGSNFTDYIREAHRALKIDGTLHIWEPTSRFEKVDQFCHGLSRLGFRALPARQHCQFTHIEALKSPNAPMQNFELRFRGET